MIDWGAHVDDVVELLQREFAIADRPAIEVLLSALAPCPRTPAVWLVLETNWYSRECLDAWFSFGELWAPCSLARLRGRKPWREIEIETRDYLDAPSDERLFVECDFERYPNFSRVSHSQFLLQRSLRIRTVSTRVANPLRGLDTREEERRADELSAYTRAVIEDPLGARSPDPPAFREPPPNFLYHCELVQRLAPWYLDWNVLLRSFGALAVRHAWLYGRRAADARDAQILARVAADSVPVWIATAIRMLMKGPAKSNTLENAMHLEEKTRRSGYGAHRELMRLRKGGLIQWNAQKMHWTIANEHREGLAAIVDGRAFREASASSAA